MKPSKPHRAIVLALAASAFTSACSAFNPDPDVDIRAVPVDLTFGADVTGTQTPLPQASFPPPGEIVLPPPPVFRPPPLPDVDLCPPPDPSSAPEEIAEPTVKNKPKEKPNLWLYHFSGAIKGKEPTTAIGYRRIGQVALNPSGKGWNFTVLDDFTRATFWFGVIPQAEGEQEDGLYLKQIILPRAKGKKTVEFIPAKPSEESPSNPGAALHGLKMVDFPILPGATLTESAADSAAKEKTGVNDPLGITQFRPAANTITSTVDVGVRDIIDVCDEAAQAWRINWTLEVKGEWDWTMIGTFWIAPQFGGFPIKDDYILFGDGKVIQGTFASNLMKVDPGRYV